MKIVHICLCDTFADGWNYQENMLAKFHAKEGNEVTVITSLCKQIDGIKNNKFEKANYINEDGIHIIRLPIKHGHKVSYRFKRYCKIIETIEKENANILFIHGCQFLDIIKIANYLKNNNIEVYIDNHADFSNSATNLLSRYFLHGIIWKYCANKIEPYVKKFYGVLPARVDFLQNIYKLPRQKIYLLLMGADDDLVESVIKNNSREIVRHKYHIKPDDFLLVTGGKIDMPKRQTILLIEAVKKIENIHLKLIIFGSVVPELKDKILNGCDGNRIQFVGWANSIESYEYFSAADLAVFPGRHSVYWEQAAGQGIPLLVKDWAGTHHVDLNGNAVFINEDSVNEIQKRICEIVNDADKYKEMKQIAVERGLVTFSYKNIAKKSIEG